jgi:uncharacterized surface protein with fasciclin (FAS1) repeats
MVTKRMLGIAAASAALAAAGATPARAQRMPFATLLDAVTASRDLSRFVALVKAAGIEDQLTRPGQFSLFAPHDPYFDSLSAPSMAELTANTERLRRVLLTHVATRSVMVVPGGAGGGESGADITLLQTLSGRSIAVWNGGGAVPRVEGRKIWVANLWTGNGIAHCIDGFIGGWHA